MINRREFFLRSAATAGAAAFANFPYHLFAGTTQKLASDRVKLGPMQIEVSRLAQGSGTDGSGGSSNQTRKLGLRVTRHEAVDLGGFEAELQRFDR